MEEHSYFWYLAAIPALGIAAQWLAWRLRLPSILLLLAFGVLLGQLANPDEILNEVVSHHGGGEESIASRLLFPFISLSVAVILFEGGLSLRLHELDTAGRGVFRLVTVGVAVSWLLTTLAAIWIFEFDTGVATLLGAVLVVTGPTVVAPLLRHIRPVRKVGSLVKWEGIVIDPIGAVLAVIAFESLLPLGHETSFMEMAMPLVRTTFYGVSIGLVTGVVLVQLVMRYWIPDFLHGVFFLAVALVVFAASNTLQEESGLVTVTVLGVFLANQRKISIQHVVEFKEHLGVFLISSLFIVLGSRLDPSKLLALGWDGILFLAILIIVVRPAAVFAATIATKLTFQERLFLAFLAPRGIVAAAVTSVFALKIASVAAGNPDLTRLAEQADMLMPITFLVIVGSVAIYGLLAAPLAARLGLADTNPQGILFAGADSAVRDIAEALQEEGIHVFLVDTNYGNIAAAKMQGLSAECISILQEHEIEKLELAGIGRLLAMTPNDEVNTLAASEFNGAFGRANVYQLAPWDERAGRRSSIAEHLRGRILFNSESHYDEVIQKIREGSIKKTRLTDEFSIEDFQDRYGDSSLILFVIEKSGTLKIQATDEPFEPKAGDLVVAVIDEEATAEATNGA